jgi:hypothetical protein
MKRGATLVEIAQAGFQVIDGQFRSPKTGAFYELHEFSCSNSATVDDVQQFGKFVYLDSQNPLNEDALVRIGDVYDESPRVLTIDESHLLFGAGDMSEEAKHFYSRHIYWRNTGAKFSADMVKQFFKLLAEGKKAALDIHLDSGEIVCRFSKNQQTNAEGLGTPGQPFSPKWERVANCENFRLL